MDAVAALPTPCERLGRLLLVRLSRHGGSFRLIGTVRVIVGCRPARATEGALKQDAWTVDEVRMRCRELVVAAGLAAALCGSAAGCGSSPAEASSHQQLFDQADTSNGRGTATSAMDAAGTSTIDCSQLYKHELATTYAGAPDVETPHEAPFEAGCQQAVSARSATGAAAATASPSPAPSPTSAEDVWVQSCLDGSLIYIPRDKPVRDVIADTLGMPATRGTCQIWHDNRPDALTETTTDPVAAEASYSATP